MSGTDVAGKKGESGYKHEFVLYAPLRFKCQGTCSRSVVDRVGCIGKGS